MAERDRAAVDVELIAVEAKFAVAGEDLRGEGFVEFDEIEVFEREFVFLLHLAQGWHRANAHGAWVYPNRRESHDARERFEIVLLNERFAGEDDGSSTIRNAGRIASRDGASF